MAEADIWKQAKLSMWKLESCAGAGLPAQVTGTHICGMGAGTRTPLCAGGCGLNLLQAGADAG